MGITAEEKPSVGPAKYAFDFLDQQLGWGDRVAFPYTDEDKVGLKTGNVIEIAGVNSITIGMVGGEQTTMPSRQTIRIWT